tara:strand:- start:710 stop:925 length:216 start_codon:yes stop_codon:yes gene_type:complete
MNTIGLYDTMIMGYRVKIQPYKITIFDEDCTIEGTQVPDKLVKYIIQEGFCDGWLADRMAIKVNVYRVKDI